MECHGYETRFQYFVGFSAGIMRLKGWNGWNGLNGTYHFRKDADTLHIDPDMQSESVHVTAILNTCKFQ